MLEIKSSIRFEGYVIDRQGWSMRWSEEPIALNRKSFDVLLYLIDHRDRVVSKSELLEKIWEGQFVEESNLAQQVFLLRKALSRHDSRSKIIETIPGRGYRFTAPIKEWVEAPVGEPETRIERIVLSATESITRITVEEEEEDDSPSSPSLAPDTSVIDATTRTGVHEQENGQGLSVQTGADQGVRGVRIRIGWRWVLAASFVVLVLSIAGWFGWQRWLDRESGAPVDVVIAPMAGSTGDAVLDQALVVALRTDLSQSPFVSIVTPARIRETLREMKQKPDAEMTSSIARDVCERTNSQAVLFGNIARLGQHFLLTEEATSCVNGAMLANAKYEASTTEDLPHGIDKLAEGLRHGLGESRRSIARFDVPLFVSINTSSLEALKEYTLGATLADQGKYEDATNLMKKAIAADPDFAEAYYGLAAGLRALHDPVAEKDAILKAYSLRDSANESTRLAIIALYHYGATQDLYEAERNYRTWTELYPRAGAAWNNLSAIERDLGHHAETLAAARHALELRPDVTIVYGNVAYGQLETGDMRGALSTCESAIATGHDSDHLRGYCFESAYALHDAALVQKQRDWAAAHPDAILIRQNEVDIAVAEGRFSDARRLFPQLEAIIRHRGVAAPADEIVRAESIDLIDAGEVEEGRRLFRSVPVDPKSQYSILGLASVGDSEAAASDLRAMQTEFPQGTIWNDYLGPEVQAINAMTNHKPDEAIAALERIRPLEGRDPLITMMRADAYLAKGEAGLAEKEYRRVIDSPVQDPIITAVPLSWLGLGRALAAEGNRTSAIEAYKHFFMLWAHADPDARFLVQAKGEFNALHAQL
ncbi:winged helix-turn-helix domain-containing protein [Acidicapsa ligni]|uniref:winged helix-turn-helix domain-containing protein n=1 Tax=Acidicapsa ligni TaxID=542300 RepID=UPI0021DFAF7A|nr:winged helix-turn-helix domain-containing protein [Acidicapsa ligni]